MKPAPFEYLRPRSLGEAAVMLEQGGEGAQILAGGQSLIPTLSLRLARPSVLIDINRVEDSAALAEQGGTLRCGARVRHVELEHSALTRRCAPLLAMAMPHVAHPAIRNRGTPCGSVALADPAAEIPACALALNAQIMLQSAKGTRSVLAENYFLRLYETARTPSEVVAELRFPVALAHERFGFIEFARRHGDFAIVGIAVAARLEGTSVASLRLVIFGCEPIPRVSAAAAKLAAGCDYRDLPVRQIAEAVASELDPMENAQGDAHSKRRQARALTARVLMHMLAGEST
jgi:carbon-monoxide dehydrogenase medium subunit